MICLHRAINPVPSSANIHVRKSTRPHAGCSRKSLEQNSLTHENLRVTHAVLARRLKAVAGWFSGQLVIQLRGSAIPVHEQAFAER